MDVSEPVGPPPALFDAAATTAGVMRRAMIENLGLWRKAGRAISPATSVVLLAQSDAVDLALSFGKATQVSGATRVLLELLTGFKLLDEVPAAGGATLDAFLAEVEKAANGGS